MGVDPGGPGATAGAAASSREETGVVVVVRAPDTLSHDRAAVVREAMDNLGSDGWWFLNPGTFIAVFLGARDSTERLEKAHAMLERLISQSPALHDLATGSAEGRLLCAFDAAGHLQSLPLGHTVNVALTEAVRNAG
jgi:hypothetical protein